MVDITKYQNWFNALTGEQKEHMSVHWKVAYDACAEGNFAMVAGIIENILFNDYPVDGVVEEKPTPQLPEELDKEWQLYIHASIHREDGVHYDLCSVVSTCVNVYEYLVRLYTPVSEDKPNPEYLRKAVREEEKSTLRLLEELVSVVKTQGHDKLKFISLLRKIAIEDKLPSMVHGCTKLYSHCYFRDDCPWYLRNIKDYCSEVKAVM